MDTSEYDKPAVEAECITILSAEDQAALLLGRQIAAIRHALKNPDRPENLQLITDLGHDQRYYMLVRGWLGYQLQADRSIQQASEEKTPEKIRRRIELLKEAVRAIDLE